MAQKEGRYPCGCVQGPRKSKTPRRYSARVRLALYELQHWTEPGQGDGYLNFNYTVQGEQTLACGRKLPDWINADSGWLGEFTTHGVRKNCAVPIGCGQHVWTHARHFEDCVLQLYDAALRRRLCECCDEERGVAGSETRSNDADVQLDTQPEASASVPETEDRNRE